MNSLFDCLAQQDGSRPAVVAGSATVTVERILARARSLRHRGWLEDHPAVAKGDNIIDFLEVLVGCEGWAESLHLQPAGAVASSEPVAGSIRPLPDGHRTKLVLATSGTTGKPKLVVHTLASLTATTKTYSSGALRHRWGLLYDPARFAGLQVVLQALLGGATMVVPENKNIDQAVDFMIVQGVTALSATPSYWRQLLMARSVGRLKLKQITLGGEIADARILRALHSLFPSCRIVHIYASTETGVGFSVRDGKPGFPLSYLDDSVLDGVRLRITKHGRLLMMKARPEHRAETAASVRRLEEGFVDTGDLVEVRGDRVYFLGRASGLINVGGNKVYPETIEAVICSHPGVVGARVFAKPSSILGNLVAADVQLENPFERDLIVGQLNELCREKLSRFQWPAVLNVVKQLEISESGKISRSQTTHG
jgi:acyl-CoA synthetase (AMP-forming)/AMP-acid ligase II